MFACAINFMFSSVSFIGSHLGVSYLVHFCNRLATCNRIKRLTSSQGSISLHDIISIKDSARVRGRLLAAGCSAHQPAAQSVDANRLCLFWSVSVFGVQAADCLDCNLSQCHKSLRDLPLSPVLGRVPARSPRASMACFF